jgi:hypothetical protein
LFWEAGKNRDGYFAADDVLSQVDRAIDIFESKTDGRCTGLFMFDNAPSHQKRADNALSARYTPKGLKLGWLTKAGVKMRDGWWINAQGHCVIQPLYFANDHPTHPGAFKGMQQILTERGLWPIGRNPNASCDGFKCLPDATQCCARRMLFNQPDFSQQKSALTELVEGRGHICDYYPKYHCELNFIEQYWGAAKYRYRNSPATHSMDDMRANVRRCLDDVPLISIQRCVACFIPGFIN